MDKLLAILHSKHCFLESIQLERSLLNSMNLQLTTLLIIYIFIPRPHLVLNEINIVFLKSILFP